MIPFIRRGVIAVIPFSGVLTMRSVAPVVELIEYAEKARRIKGVLLNLSSQGGSVTATEVLVMALARLKEKKPLFVWTTMAASGGYYAAAIADRIVAVPSAVIGSIGVIFLKPDISGVMNRLGIKVEVLKEGALKDDTLPTKKMSPTGRSKIEAINREVYNDFVSVVAKGRKLPEKAVRKVATGEIFTARRGKQLGLVDELGDLRSAIDALAKEVGVKPHRVIQMRVRRPWLYSFFDRGVRAAAVEVLGELFGSGLYY
jgi:protease IV